VTKVSFLHKMNVYPNLKLKPGKEKSLERRHPWVFSGALQADSKETPEGCLVNVCTINGEYLATGYVQHGSIAIRIVSFEGDTIDINFWEKRVQNSLNLRQQIPGIYNEGGNCFRLMHGEGDDVPGLIIDIYNNSAVIQCHSSGIYEHIELISEAIQSVFGDKIHAIYNKSKESLHGQAGETENGFLLGDLEESEVIENGHQFIINWKTGQKTGFFLDQRENRKLLGQYAKGKTVLNTFAYTGGFSVYALANGASKVDSVDVSKTAIDILNRNIELNAYNVDSHSSFAEDTFVFFKNTSDVYDIVILDPPAFAKNMSSRHNALMGYKRLNIEGLKKVKPGGLLFTFSCSQVVDTETFNKTIFSAALESGRNIKILHRLTQGPDHPVNMYHPEGDYLKGLVLYVE
jgi:23S rRNA (cytosine1962-C5)-methyltransferase